MVRRMAEKSKMYKSIFFDNVSKPEIVLRYKQINNFI